MDSPRTTHEFLARRSAPPAGYEPLPADPHAVTARPTPPGAAAARRQGPTRLRLFRPRHWIAACLLAGFWAVLAGAPAAQENDDDEDIATDVAITGEEAALYRGATVPRLPDADVFALEQRRQALDGRALELDDRERQLDVLRQELDQRLDRLTTLERAMNDYLNRWRKEEEANLAQLVKVYSAMKPPAAATAVEAMEERLATALLERMPEKKAAKIMDLLPAEKAVTIARRMGQGIP
jgi:flagellar motility protein MotE (MotC chaperone)